MPPWRPRCGRSAPAGGPGSSRWRPIAGVSMSARARTGTSAIARARRPSAGSRATSWHASARCWRRRAGSGSSALPSPKSTPRFASPRKARSPRPPSSRRMYSPDGGRELTYAQALYEATAQEMERDPDVFVFGLGVDDPKGMYGTTQDLHRRFGALRNFDTPLSEDAMTGVAIGAALAGMRPIHVHQRMDFVMLCMNQLVNLAAKTRYLSGGESSLPMVGRAIIGRSWGQGAQHSQ